MNRLARAAAPPNSRLLYYATRSGGATLDVDEQGGNPFATALIELVHGKGCPLGQLASRLAQLTDDKTAGYQQPECIGRCEHPDWRLGPKPHTKRESRLALVLVVSGYAAANGGPLRGAARDERRMATTLAAIGFTVIQGISPRRPALVQTLKAFRERSANADVSVIYATGHGLELADKTYLMPADYPNRLGFGAETLARRAVPVDDLTVAGSSRHINLAFFAGCRAHANATSPPQW